MLDTTLPDYSNTPASNQRPIFGYTPLDPGCTPRVTIITPFYNTSEIFHETAVSVFRQSFQQWEWLIINDGSTDPASLALLEAYRHRDPRIRVIDHEHNRGLSAARNTGFQQAAGEYVAQLDSDDLLEPTALEKWFWFLESHPEYGFVNGYTVGFGAQQYLWEKGFENSQGFLEDNQVDATCLIRRPVHQAVGGYDEANRSGLEDWEFWLRCASNGYWGKTIPEYLDWYRRRASHNDRWSNFDYSKGHAAFRTRLKEHYPQLWQKGMPTIQPRWHMPNELTPDRMPAENLLAKSRPRLLMLVPWLTFGGADKFNLDMMSQLMRRGWEISVVATLRGDQSWLPQFTRLTPDVFVLDHFLRLIDYPRFLRYLIHSRQPDVVFVSHSELSYLLLPYLRCHAPEPAYVDYTHMEEEDWKGGGYPRMTVQYQEMLDLSITASQHVKNWMVEQGAEESRLRVCYINIDPQHWKPDPELRHKIRLELGLSKDLPVIFFAGRIHPQKQPAVLANTMLLLKQRGLSFAAWVAGDGIEMEWLRSFIKKNHLQDTVRLFGAVPSERVHDLMAAADIFLITSRWEGIALTYYEAMATGIPVVGARVGGQDELVTPECGVLLERGGTQEEEAAQYADTLAEMLHNPAGLRQMGQAGRQRILNGFHLDQMGDQIETCLQEAKLLHNEQPRPLPGPGLARACASEAVEYIRLFEFTDQLWFERMNLSQLWAQRKSPEWRKKLYDYLYHLHEPYYRWYTSKGLTWFDPIRAVVKKILLRNPKG